MAKSAARSIVAVEFSPAYLKLVEFLPLENQIAMVAIKPLEVSQWGNDAYLQTQIRATIAKHIQSKNIDLIGSVSAGHAVLRTVEIPEGEDNPLDALQWDMEQYLARPLDDYFMDYQALGPNAAENGRLYLVAAYRRSEIDRIQRLLESAGFPLVVLDVDAFAAINAFEANYPEMQPGRALLVKADAEALTCIRSQGGMFSGCEAGPVDPAIFNLNGQAKTDRLKELVQTVHKQLDAARGSWGEVENVLLCGDLSLDGEFRELLSANLSVPLTPLNAFKEVAFALSPEQTERLMPSAPQCAAALGLALRRGGDC